MVGYQLDDETKSLHGKWLEITISIHKKLVGFRVPGSCTFEHHEASQHFGFIIAKMVVHFVAQHFEKKHDLGWST